MIRVWRARPAVATNLRAALVRPIGYRDNEAMTNPPTPRTALACLAGAFSMASACAAGASATTNFALAEDGASVIDQRAKLVWARCVEGMQWDGKTCSGTPRRLGLAQANALAAARAKADGLPWRLPRVIELQHLIDKAANPSGPDPKLFPAAPRDWHWSATANVGQPAINAYNYGNVMQGRSAETAINKAFAQGWAVHLGSGEARSDAPKRSGLTVRLVRAQE